MAANIKSSHSAGCPRPKFKAVRVVLATLAWLHPASVPALRAQEPGVSLKLDIVAWGDAIPGLSLKAAGGHQRITAEAFTYSDPVSYTGPAVMEIYQNATDTGSSGATGGTTDGNVKQPASGAPKPALKNPTATPMDTPAAADPATTKNGLALELERRRKDKPSLVALASLPADCTRATVLLSPAGGGTFEALVLDDDPSRLPVGKLRVHNLSPCTVAIRFQTNPPATKELKTNESIVVPATDQHVIYELAYKLGEEWNLQENNILKVRPDEQTQMILLHTMHPYFVSSDGSTSGFLQVITLRRNSK
jgi:hypothetical protein